MKQRLSLVLSGLALVVALLALTPLGQAALEAAVPNNSVGSSQLKNNAVVTAKIKNGAVNSDKIKDASITSKDVKNATLKKEDFASGQLPAGAAGPAGPAGAAGPAGPAGPSDGYASFKNGPIGNGGQVAVLNVPQAGNYIFAAKLWAKNNGGAATLTCTLAAEGDQDQTTVRLGASGLAADQQSLAFTVAHVFAGAGTVTLSCTDSGATTQSNWIKITGIRLGTLANTASG